MFIISLTKNKMYNLLRSFFPSSVQRIHSTPSPENKKRVLTMTYDFQTMNKVNVCLDFLIFYRPHTEYDGKVMFSVCLFTGAPQVKVQGAPRSRSGEPPRSRSRGSPGQGLGQGQGVGTPGYLPELGGYPPELGGQRYPP